jgi:predicted GIY-YIG superfamily endonuclease
MQYVYILQSKSDPERYYIGTTSDLKLRLAKHNRGEVHHTAKFMPWDLKTYLAFDQPAKAFAFEAYLKSASGRAFAKKRL